MSATWLRRTTSTSRTKPVSSPSLHPRCLPDSFFSTAPKYTPCDHQSTISTSTTEKWEKELLEDPKNKLALNALQSNNVQAILQNTRAAVSDTQIFNLKIPFEGAPVTNQRSSGRCWVSPSSLRCHMAAD